MVSNEETTTFSTGSGNQPRDQKIVLLSSQSNGQVALTSIPGGGISKVDRIRGVTNSLVVDALAILDEMWEDCQESPDLRENYYQLHHCLDYLKRFCEGKV
jgi:hypothetical protein